MIHSLPNPRLIYVAGYGRSGSTLLDTILGNHPAIFGAGEVFRLFGNTAEKCSCGTTLDQCSFWQSVRERAFQADPSMDYEKAAALTTRTHRKASRADRDAYARLWRATFQAIAEISGKAIIVDSSKSDRVTCSRLSILAKDSGLPIKVVHLVRHVQAIMWSTLRGNNRLLEQGGKPRKAKDIGGAARGLFGWIFANRFVDRLHRRNRGLTLHRVRYEDLVCDPTETFEALGDFLEIGLREVVERLQRGEAFDPGHGVSGNRMRRKGPIVVQFDQEWREKLSNRSRMLSLMARPMMKKYGYC